MPFLSMVVVLAVVLLIALMFLRAQVQEVQFGAKADRSTQAQDGAVVYANKRAEMWGLMREWLAGGMIANDPDLIADLTGVEYGYVLREGRDAIQLEKKEDMRKRGLASPDSADAACPDFRVSGGFLRSPAHHENRRAACERVGPVFRYV